MVTNWLLIIWIIAPCNGSYNCKSWNNIVTDTAPFHSIHFRYKGNCEAALAELLNKAINARGICVKK